METDRSCHKMTNLNLAVWTLEYSVTCTISNTASSFGVILPWIRISFHVNERLLNISFMFYHTLLTFLHGRESNQLEFAEKIRRIKQVSSRSPTEPLLMFLRPSAAAAVRHLQHQALDHRGKYVRHGQRGEAAPRHAPLSGTDTRGGNWQLRPAICYWISSTDCYCLQNEV